MNLYFWECHVLKGTIPTIALTSQVGFILWDYEGFYTITSQSSQLMKDFSLEQNDLTADLALLLAYKCLNKSKIK